MAKNKVFVVGGDALIERMFRQWGWELADNVEDACLVQFTGGADVSPSLYGEANIASQCNPDRDRQEALIFRHALAQKRPMAGICRGGQFLNVMCGGKMWQDVDGHLGTHDAIDTLTGTTIRVTSTHHQMMIPGPTGQIVLTAACSSSRTKGGHIGEKRSIIFSGRGHTDIEGIFYNENGCLCFQPHPEYSGAPGLDEYYFGTLNEFFGLESEEKKEI